MLTALLLYCSTFAGAQTAEEFPALDQHVLALVPGGFAGANADQFIVGMMDSLLQRGIKKANIHVEYLDLTRHPEPEFRAALNAMLHAKYGHQKIDAVFCLNQNALNFLLSDIPDIGPEALVFCRDAKIPPAALSGKRKFVTLETQFDFRGTLQRALELFPKTERVIIIQGNSENELLRKPLIYKALAPFSEHLLIEDTQALSFSQIEEKLASAPENTIVLSLGINRDAAGHSFVPVESNRSLLKVSRAPMFVVFDSHLGFGALGGMVSRPVDQGTRMAEKSVEWLRNQGELSAALTELTPAPHTSMFDWAELQRWGGKVAALPKDTLFIHRPPTLWGQYKGIVISGSLIILLLLALLIALFTQNHLRRLADERFRLLVEQAPEGILVLDAETHTVLNANPSAEKIFSTPRDALIGSNLERFYAVQQPDGRPVEESLRANIQRTLAGELVHTERAIWSANGHDLFCDVSLTRLPDPKRKMIRLSYIDVTQRKQAEEALNTLNRELEQRVDERTQALQKTATDLQQTLGTLHRTQAELVQHEKVAALGRMVAGIAHELNTPIGTALVAGSTLHHMTELLKEHMEAGTLKKSSLLHFSREYAEGSALLEKALLRAGQLVADFSKATQNHSAELCQSFELQTCLQALHAKLVPRFQNTTIRLELAIPSGIQMHSLPGLLTLVVEQLVDNARTHAFDVNEEGLISIAAREQDNDVELMVRDTGRGISPELQNSIFDPFFTTQMGQAKGLGLHAVFSMVTGSLRGSIDVNNETPHGSRFTIRIPKSLGLPQ